ncbi:zinc ribbon domain-containing protein [Acinetobacter gerneri]|uniref:Zinc-ribbon domain-containing protein n=1 Tax=Acinetobacter gerneri DSM 14967 = CIP 107464 = MTCC 9824 TaxID=1120926 RepID=N8Y9J0_9GAMM|nr:zinc ribbon domain-containing protein [Acinetobacter gerneri]ENV33432.1 hypothetical protein F960_02465 [Acinetobacter gerneri DSM 14967 = CIP 107464 = MTCC 9824]
MNCQKCGATNINEAVFCGMCGKRLHHPKMLDDFTGHSSVQSSYKRTEQNSKNPLFNQKKPFKKQKATPVFSASQTQRNTVNSPPQIPKQSPQSQQDNRKSNIFEEASKVSSLKELTDLLSKTWNEKSSNEPAKASSSKRKNPKNWIFVAIFIFIFFSPILSFITSSIPWLGNQLSNFIHRDEAVPAEDAVAVADEAVAGAEQVVDDQDPESTANQIYARFQGVKQIQPEVEQYYLEHKRMPLNLKQIEAYSDTGQTDYTYKNFAIVRDGIVVGKFEHDPDKKIYAIPHINKGKIVRWTCATVNLDSSETNECIALTADPYASR